MTLTTDLEAGNGMFQALRGIRELEMENEVLWGAAACLLQAHITPPEMIYPLVKEMAVVGAPVRVPVAVTCRVLGLSIQVYYKWLGQSVSAREVEDGELIAVLGELSRRWSGRRLPGVWADDIAELG